MPKVRVLMGKRFRSSLLSLTLYILATWEIVILTYFQILFVIKDVIKKKIEV